MNLDLTFFAEIIAFALFVWLTMRYLWPPLMQAMDERAKKIADGLAAAERAMRDLELAQERAVSVLHDARREAATIVEGASQRANELLERAEKAAAEQSARELQHGREELDRAREQARMVLQKDVASLALEAARQIIAHEIDPERHAALLKSVAERLQ
ncbi:ATPase, F0 complex, subunit B, bacterial [mine drainage metagenome]|uniref:ATPase, F0 complex, subunit B, bacterial n=2 Tax=mine drainage metagenome TaxID=410659 RepID=T1BU41_9ZZZZ